LQLTGAIQAQELLKSADQAVKNARETGLVLITQPATGVVSATEPDSVTADRTRLVDDALAQTLALLRPAEDIIGSGSTSSRKAVVDKMQKVMGQLNEAVDNVGVLTDEQVVGLLGGAFGALETAFAIDPAAAKTKDATSFSVPVSMVPNQRHRATLTAKLHVALQSLQLASNYLQERSAPSRASEAVLSRQIDQPLDDISAAAMRTAIVAFNSSLQAYSLASNAVVGDLQAVYKSSGQQLRSVLVQTSLWYQKLRAQVPTGNQVKPWLNGTGEVKIALSLS